MIEISKEIFNIIYTCQPCIGFLELGRQEKISYITDDFWRFIWQPIRIKMINDLKYWNKLIIFDFNIHKAIKLTSKNN